MEQNYRNHIQTWCILLDLRQKAKRQWKSNYETKGMGNNWKFFKWILTLFQRVTSICISEDINEKIPGKIDKYVSCMLTHFSVIIVMAVCVMCGHTHVKPQDQFKISCTITFHLIFWERASDSTWNLAI